MNKEYERYDQLITAAFEGDLHEVKRHIEHGCDINASGAHHWNPLHAAIENEQIEIVEFLLKRGAKVDIVNKGLTPLAHAVDISIDGTTQTGGQLGDEPTDILKLLIDYGADILPGLDIAQDYQNIKITNYLKSFSTDE